VLDKISRGDKVVTRDGQIGIAIQYYGRFRDLDVRYVKTFGDSPDLWPESALTKISDNEFDVLAIMQS